MANIRIPFLVARRNKAGVVSWYWQPSALLAKAGWEPIALGKDEAGAVTAARARNTEIELWKAGGRSVHRPAQIRDRRMQGTVGALIERYRADVVNGKHAATGAARLKPGTREVYETALKRIEAWAGKHPIAFVTPARVRALRDATAPAPRQGKDGSNVGGIGHAAAFNLLKVLRQLFAYAESVDVIAKGSNPATKFDLGAPPPRSRVWEADDEAAFRAAAIDLGYPSLALAIELAIYSGQREGDLITMTEAQVQPIVIHDATVRAHFADAKDGSVIGWRLAQAKSTDVYVSADMEIAFAPDLRAKVEAAIRTNRARDRAAERLQTYVIVDDDRDGQQWKKRYFIKAWRKVIAHAAKQTGRPSMLGLVWHDLRRTRVVRLRRRGMNPAMIAAITGHNPQSINMMLKVYGPIDPMVTAAALAAGIAAAG